MDLAALQTLVGERAPMPSHEVRQTNPNMIAHIDGDYLAYFAAGGPDCSAGEARRNVLSRVSRLKSASGAAKVVIHLTHSASTKGDRFLAATTQPYQGQRTHSSKPINWAFLRDWLENYDGDAFTPKVWKTREADDGVAHVCTQVARHTGVLHAIHTKDKDFQMFCGLHVDWSDYTITEVPLGAYDVVSDKGKQFGHKWFWMQMLMGDTADHIPGLPRVGPARAAEALSGTTCNEDAAKVVYGVYRNIKGENWQPYFVEQAVLLWMRTDRDAALLNVLELGVFSHDMNQHFLNLSQSVRERRDALEALKQ